VLLIILHRMIFGMSTDETDPQFESRGAEKAAGPFLRMVQRNEIDPGLSESRAFFFASR
jgi:hypothetical protein